MSHVATRVARAVARIVRTGPAGNIIPGDLMSWKPIAIVGLVLTTACANGDPDGPTLVEFVDEQGVVHERHDDEDHAGEDVELVSKDGAEPAMCRTRWRPNASATAAGDRQRVTYQGASGRCSGGATPGAVALGDYLRQHLGHLMNLSVPGRGVQIYACRNIRGNSSPSVHGEGRAIDIFIPTGRSGAADNARGDVIAHWLMANAEHIGVQMIIWDRTVWRANGGAPRARCYTGTHPHNDHIHIELTRAGAQKQTPFFRSPAQPPAPPAQPDPGPADSPAPAPPPPAASRAWIGDSCAGDADCGFTADGQTGRCFREHGPVSGRGFCTVPCAGFCADRSGYAPTFCSPAEAVGGRPGNGTCVSKSSTVNDRCRQNRGFVELDVERFVGRSGAARVTARICAPEEALGFDDPAPPPPQPNPEPDPAPPPPANNVCDAPGLPMSDHGLSCAGTPAETWRCACSGRLETVVSQVCRSGRWVNYHTDPADCSRCNGPYTRGCE